MANDYTILAAIEGLIGLIWLAVALSALAGYSAFKQRTVLYWILAFVLLALVRFGDAYVARHWAAAAALTPQDMPETAQFAAFYGLRFGAIEIAAAFAFFYLFRQRRKTY
jgi:hypothetical protein